MSMKFQPDTDAGEKLYDWWQSLEQNTGERALLRRARSVNEVAMSRAFHHLCNRMRPFMNSDHPWEDQLAAVAGLASHVRQITAEPLAQQMAGNPPEVSELRFRRLLQRGRGDLYASMIRILRMLDHKANLYDLANSVFYWGDNVKKRWAYDYFPNTPAGK